MSAAVRPVTSLLLGLLWASSASASEFSRLRIPPHEQVARVARFISHRCDWASMATISSHEQVAGQPFSNAFSVSDGPLGSSSGVPYMYLTRMEVSVQDLEVNGTEAEFAKKSLFSRHPEMIDWPTDHNWFFSKFNITQVWVLDYFGGVKIVTPGEYFQASPYRKYL
uniref:protein CREG1 isoform X2 n=1 Tax=Solea senegalensis TaxID=28829 RepID=UPI001CD8D695|nr:protein CREG1 isoform X2 [Solea senegalensis]